MIDFPADLLSWLIAGLYVVLFCVIVFLIRLTIVKYSFQGLNEDIPQTDRWESIQTLFFFGNFIFPAVIGIFFSIDFLSVDLYTWFLIFWIVINFLPDFGYYLIWLSR
ncbi:MAG: hypothetical protein ACXAC7_21200 [Candidatus Hodarchaeales archaeon]|jgi:hypothetical protein